MAVAVTDRETAEPADPVVDDLSITCLAGPVTSSASGPQQAIDAERLGFRRVWVPERYTVKEAGAVLGAMAALTSRISVATGPITISSRPPVVTAALAATIQSMFGNRFTLGVGRGPVGWLPGHGFDQVDYPTFLDWVRILRQLWRGEVVDYDGPAGRYENLRMLQLPDEPPPDVVFFHLGGPRSSRLAADPAFDGVSLCNTMTPENQGRSIQQTLAECERIGRDPSTLRFYGAVTAAPDADETTMRTEVGARIVVNLQMPVLGELLRKGNGWDEHTANEIRNQPIFKNLNYGLIDLTFKRHELVDATRIVPESWITGANAVGTAEECVKSLQRYKDAGVQEIDIYAGAPAANASLIRVWREHKTRGG
jgi:probable F420-dependent oxidoreductase